MSFCTRGVVFLARWGVGWGGVGGCCSWKGAGRVLLPHSWVCRDAIAEAHGVEKYRENYNKRALFPIREIFQKLRVVLYICFL